MNVDSIERGVVIDHIAAGRGMELVRLLGLASGTRPVAVILNARSGKTGRKDIIKIEDDIDLDLDVLGFVDPGITVNIIVNSRIVEKKRMAPPGELVGVVRCKNPRCITTTEQGLVQRFTKGEEGAAYRCAYCQQAWTPEAE